jgi:hypothetical protein
LIGVSWLGWAVGGLVVFAAMGVGVIVLMVKVLRRSAERNAEETIAPLRARVSELLEEAERLKARCDRLTGKSNPGVPISTGRTGELAERAQAEVEAVWDDWGLLQKLLEGARDQMKETADLAGSGYSEAARTAGTKDADRWEADAKQHAEEASRLLTALEEAPLEAVAVVDAASAALAAVRAGAHGGGIADALPALESRLASYEPRPWTDPVGVAAGARELFAELQKLAVACGVDLGAAQAAERRGARGGDAPLSASESSGQRGATGRRSESAI